MEIVKGERNFSEARIFISEEAVAKHKKENEFRLDTEMQHLIYVSTLEMSFSR